MSNYWLIAVGINQYQYQPPLNYAQADAQALWNFLVGKAGFMPDHCLLLTDTSPFINGKPTYPSRENIQLWIDWLSKQALQQGDQVWLFFSGYGLKSDGQDYLMPIDGNAENIAATGIPMRSIYESLKASTAATQLVLLDINRNSSVSGSGLVGSQTVELARELEIPTVLSCQPNQAAYEASDLQQGLFTAALLEGLRTEGNMTLATLKRYLSERLPELCEHHWRPRQEPVVVVHPPGKSHQVILPPQGILVTSGYYGQNEQRHVLGNEAIVNGTQAPVGIVGLGVQNNPPKKDDFATPSNPFDSNLDDIEPRNNLEPKQPAPVAAELTNGHAGASRDLSEVDEDNDGAFWQNILLWGGGLLLLLLLLMSLFGLNKGKQPAGQMAGRSSTGTVSGAGKAKVPAKPKTKEEINQDRLDKAKVLLQNNQVSKYSQAIALASQIKPREPLHAQAEESIERWSQIILDTAQGRAKQGKYAQAVAAAKLVPKDPQPIYAQAQKLIKEWEPVVKKQQANTTLLLTAKGLIRPAQASSYNKAIAVARKIPAGQPAYSEAQKSIALWSQTILNLGQKRASEGNLKAAIDTASLVPAKTPAHAKAQQAIAQWKKQPQKK